VISAVRAWAGCDGATIVACGVVIEFSPHREQRCVELQGERQCRGETNLTLGMA
jgi:hypothetical protein